MPRGKNYVNNNKGVQLLAGAKGKAAMQMCEYGSGCNRPDCIYRHPDNMDPNAKADEICLPFLAGKCSFAAKGGCRKRHPKKEERARLLEKYKRTRCRFGDDCYTEGCLYLHPREVEPMEPYYIEPHDVAFPPLNGSSAPAPSKTMPADSPWKNAPTAPVPPSPTFHQEQMQEAWFPPSTPQGPMCIPYYLPPDAMGMPYYYDPQGHQPQELVSPSSFSPNANAKEWTPTNMAS